MIAGLIVPSGNLSALTPHPITVKPIAAVAVTVGALVRFDCSSATHNSTYTVSSNLINYDEPTCPFNVVVLAASTNDAGPFGIVTEAAAAGNRCTVCVAGIVDATGTGNIAQGAVVVPDAGVIATTLGTPAAAGGAPLGVALEAFTTGQTKKILFNGFVFASGGA